MKYQLKYQIYIYTQSIYTIIPTTFFLFRKKLESATTKPPGGAFARCLLLQQRDQGAVAEWSLQSLQMSTGDRFKCHLYVYDIS